MNDGEKELQEWGPGLQVQVPLEELNWQVLVLALVVVERGVEPKELLLQEGGNTGLCTLGKKARSPKGNGLLGQLDFRPLKSSKHGLPRLVENGDALC